MDCLDEGTVLAFVGGDLEGGALASAERHLVGCPACAALVAVAAPIAPAGAAGGTRRLDSVTVGRYELRQILGRGGMGEVYAAYDPELDRQVAIKILRTDVRDSEAHRARFMREAQAVARLHHANVVGIHDVGHAGDRIFLAMELIDGETLGVWLSRAPRTVPEIVRVFALAGRGVQAAHTAGVVHRDFKPQNVMVGRDCSPRVMDFGLAASADPTTTDGLRLTAAGAILGTPHYMSPEQLVGQRADARADQFSFCVALWEALHGALPFPGKTWVELRAAVLTGAAQPGPLARRVPRAIQAALLRGLSIDREARFPSMADLLSALSPRRAVGWRRPVAVAAAVLTTSAVVAGALIARAHARRTAGCDPVAGLAGVWAPAGDPNREVAREAFAAAAAEVPDALIRFSRVTTVLDQTSQHWGALWRESCEAVNSPQVEDRVAELAVGCLDRWRRELGALWRVLSHADANVARRALAGVAALDSPDACRDPAVLRATPAVDQTTRARLDPLVDRLLTLRAEAATGHDAQEVEPARSLLGEVRRTGDHRLLSETLVVVARIDAPFDPDAATPLYEEGYREAESVGLPAPAAEAALQLALIRGTVQHRFVDADRWVGLAEVAVARTHGPDETRLRGWFLDARGAVAAARGQWRQARADFSAAVSARAQAPGDIHPELGASLTHLARAATMLDDAPAALAAANRAMETLSSLFPADSYEVGVAQLARARALLAAGRTADAAADLEAARIAFERTLGREHPFLADPMTVRGELELVRGDAARARDLLERAWEIRSTQVADGGAREETAFALARAIWTTGDRTTALELAREARDGYAALPDLAGRQAATAGWIAGHPDRIADRRRRP